MKTLFEYITSLVKKSFCLGILAVLTRCLTMAASFGVDIQPFAFSPDNVTIHVNDQVVWTWVSDFHNTESDSGLWDSGIQNTGFVFTNVFTAAGSFPYFCAVHGFTGVVNVESVPTLSVTITHPPDNSDFGNTDGITIGADAADSAGTITNVSFFDGGTFLRSISASPYRFISSAFTFAGGQHALTAVALDNIGASATSAPVHITIARYTPEVTNGALSVFLVPIATNISAPLYGISPPGDTHHLFVLEQNGLVRIIQDGVLLSTPALDLQNLVQPPLNATNANDERGLLGLAFHPGFNNPSSPGYQTLYTYNSEMIPASTLPTYPLPGGTTNNYKNAVNEWKISSTNANIVDPSSLREVISFGKNAQNHNGGTCTFGPDGYRSEEHTSELQSR